MKVLKKMLSVVCAISMLATMAVSVATVHADEYPAPKLIADLTTYNDTTGEGTITVSVEGLLTGEYQYGFINAFQSAVVFDGTKFDLTYYNDDAGYDHISAGDDIKDELTLQSNYGTIIGTEYSGLLVGYAPTSARKWTNANNFVDKNTLFTFEFKVLDPTKSNTIDFKQNEITINVMDKNAYNGTVLDTVSYNTIDSTGKGLDVVNNVTLSGGDTSIVIPGNDSATADSSAILNVKPSDVGGTGDVWTNEDKTENAVAGLANFTPAAETTPTSIEWTIKATPVGGVTKEYTETFDLGASIDAAATIGLIVNYNTAEYSSVSIVSGALK